MNKKIAITLLGILLTASLFAGEEKGVAEAFNDVEEYIKNQTITPEFKKKMLEKNLMSAVTMSLHRRYLDYMDQTKDLSPTTMRYERQEGTNSLYVNFKSYFIYYTFEMDPELFLQTPTKEVFYIKPPEMDKAAVHQGEKPASTNSSTGNPTNSP